MATKITRLTLPFSFEYDKKNKNVTIFLKFKSFLLNLLKKQRIVIIFYTDGIFIINVIG